MGYNFLCKKILVSTLAKEALLKEVELTPKPGLVDKNNSGSHKDMDLNTFYKSIEAISVFFISFVNAGEEFANDSKKCFLKLRDIGLECEKAMFYATQGVNTHKGAIFSIAIVLGAYGIMREKNLNIDSTNLRKQIQKLCKNLMNQDFTCKEFLKTAGGQFYTLFNDGGIRQEAQNGYPTIFEKALPFYFTCKENEDLSLKKTLLFLMSELNDTTLWKRGGVEGLNWVKQESKRHLHVKNINEKLIELDKLFIKKNLSPGGSADMLALTWLISKLLKK